MKPSTKKSSEQEVRSRTKAYGKIKSKSMKDTCEVVYSKRYNGCSFSNNQLLQMYF